jgi:hypothetical protein
LNICKGTRLTKEQIKDLIVKDSLWSREKEVFLEMLYNQEKALAFDFSHIGKVRLDVVLLQIIKTIEHKAWQVPRFLIPKALHLVVVKMLQEKLKNGVLKYCDSLYQNPWFLVQKKSSKYKLVNATIKINKHIV